jgi:Plasma-membrane choline transporter
MYKARWVIFASIFISIFYTFVFMKFMDKCALQCAWISVVVVQLGLVGIGFLCWFARDNFIKTGEIEPDSKTSKWLLASTFVFWFVSACYCICLTCNLKSLRVSIRIIETAADFFADTKRVVLVPIFFFIVTIATFCAFVYGYICISSIGEISVDNIALQTKQIDHPDHIEYA